MGKGVLGNDPFLRGAAPRPVTPPAPEAPLPPLAPTPPEPVIARAPATPPKKQRPPDASERDMGLGAAGDSAPFDPVPATTQGDAFHPSARTPFDAVRDVLVHMLKTVASAMGAPIDGHVDDLGRDPKLVLRLKSVIDFFYRVYFRVSVEGAELLPEGRALLVANHAGAIPLDGPILAEAIARTRPELKGPRWLVEDQIFFAPLIGKLFNRLGAVRASPEHAVRLLNEGRPVLVFPEGIQGISKPFRDRYTLQRFGRGGFVKIALRTQTPIIPVAIVGSEETLPLLAKLPSPSADIPYIPVTPLGPVPLPAKWVIRFGKPIDLEGRRPEAAEDPTVVQALTEATRGSIQTMLDAVRRERKSPFLG